MQDPTGRKLLQRYDVLKARAVYLRAPTGHDGLPMMYEVRLVPIGPETFRGARFKEREKVGADLPWSEAVALRARVAAGYDAVCAGLDKFSRGELFTAEIVPSEENG